MWRGQDERTKLVGGMIKKQLIRDEGDVPHVYQDSLGYWTIGVDFLIDKRKVGSINKHGSLDRTSTPLTLKPLYPEAYFHALLCRSYPYHT